MRVLVTGATGFVGQHLVLLLRRSGVDTVLLVREAYGLGHPLPPSLSRIRRDLHLVFADLRNFRLTGRALSEAKPDTVIHLAAAGVTDPYLAIDTALRHNTVGTINLIRAAFAQDGSARQFIVARTPGEVNPSSAYQASKAAAWSFCQMFANQEQWPICGATIYQAYGPGQPGHTLVPSAMTAARNGQNFPMTSGAQRRDWIHIDDVVEGLVALAQASVNPGTSADLGTGQATSLLDVVRAIYSFVGQGGAPLPGALADRPGEDREQIANVELSRDLLDWQPKIALKDGLRRLLQSDAQDRIPHES